MLRVTGCGVTRCMLRAARCGVNSRQSEIPARRRPPGADSGEAGGPNPNSEIDSIPNTQSKNLAFNLLAVIIDRPYIYFLRVPGNFIGLRMSLDFTPQRAARNA